MKKKKISNPVIRMMNYDQRVRNYEREKNELFDKISNLSAIEVSEAHRKLAEKWGI